MSAPQKGHFRLSALSQLTVSLICLPHLEHVISSGKLSKNMVSFRLTKLPELAKLGLIYCGDGCSEKMTGDRFEEGVILDVAKRIVPTRKFNVQRPLHNAWMRGRRAGCALPDEAPRGLLARDRRNH
jgi:hypothetical protein